jgi:hypothetical protein
MAMVQAAGEIDGGGLPMDAPLNVIANSLKIVRMDVGSPIDGSFPRKILFEAKQKLQIGINVQLTGSEIVRPGANFSGLGRHGVSLDRFLECALRLGTGRFQRGKLSL